MLPSSGIGSARQGGLARVHPRLISPLAMWRPAGQEDKPVGVALEIGEGPVALLRLQAVDRILETKLVFHRLFSLSPQPGRFAGMVPCLGTPTAQVGYLPIRGGS